MANRDVEALAAALQIGDKTGGNYTEFETDGHQKRIGTATNSRASMFTTLPGSYPTTLTTADTYYKIAATFFGRLLSRFTVSAAGVLTYTGDGEVFSLTGVSDLHCSRACELTYGLYLNGVLISGTETPVTVTAANKDDNIAITGLIELATGDTLEVYAKSDTASTVLTVQSLRITMWGA